MRALQVIAIVISFGLSAVAIYMTVRAVRSILSVLRTGTPSMKRSENPVGRSITMFKETFGHTRMLQWTWVGIMHWFVYLGFIVLSGAVFTGYFQLFDQDFQLPIIGHWFVYEWVDEALGVLSTVGIVFLIVYRQLHHPRREGRSSRFYRSTFWQAYFVEVMALLEGAAILFIRGGEWNLGRAKGDDPSRFTRFHFPISSFFGDVLYPTSAHGAQIVIISVALFKITLAMVWLIVISSNLTMGIAWHRFTAWPNIWFKREPSGRTALGAIKPLTVAGKPILLDDIDDLDEDSRLGVGAVEDFSWKNILDFTTCTECGRCQSQCPAWNTEKPLNPKLLITALRDATYAKAAPDASELEKNRPLIGDTGDDWFYNPESGAAVIDPDVLWNCTSCGACVQQCPVDIEHVDHIMDMRRYAVLVESNFPAELNGLFKGLENKGNPWNMSTTARMDWAKGLDFEVKVVGETIESLEEVDWLFWVGCAGAYEDRAKKTTRAVAELLDRAGVSFGVLGNGETCTGDPARRAGNEFVFQGLAQQNVETFKEMKVKQVVTTCAHCFNTLKNEYQQFGIELEVTHHTQLLNRLVREGKLTPVATGEGAHKRSITYHDPCYIGRHNGVYTPPRELLSVLPGADFVEMPRNSEKSFCCGAGGARMWMEENLGTRINVNRTTEAVATGADQIAVGCPFCRIMLSDGLTSAQSKGEAREEVEVLDVAQMLLASVRGEVATKVKPGGAPVEAKAAPTDDATTDVATKDEPEAGDVTVTEDTVTTTEDAGPLAKASGGSSLFDTPEAQAPAETADEDTSVADEAQAAKPASSGGSLFDVGGDAPEPTAKAEPEPEAKAAEPAAEAEAKPAAASGGSLFDIPATESAPAAETEPATEPEPAAEPETAAEAEPAAEPEDKTEAPAEAEPQAAPAAKPAADLGSGGSLFDIPAQEAAPAPAAPAAEKADEPEAEEKSTAEETAPAEPAPAEPAAAKPTVDLGSGGSLFDIPVQEAAPAAKPAEKTAEPEAAAEPEAEPAADEAPAESASEEPAAETAPAEPAAAKPTVDLGSGGSLFDIAAPEPPKAAEPTPEPKAQPDQPAAEVTATEPTKRGSLFDIAAPATLAAPTPEPEASEPEPEASEPEASKPEPEPEAPAAEASSGGGASVTQTTFATPDTWPTGGSSPEPEADPTDTAPTEEATPEAEAPTEAEAPAEAEAVAADPEPADGTEPEAAVPTESQPPSGDFHTPKTDADISGASSLFDL